MASAVGTQTADTGASAAVSSMQMAQKDAVSLTELYSQVMNDAKQLKSSGQSGYAPNTAIAHDVNNAVRAGQQMQYDYFTPLNQMNASAHEFVNAATDQLQMMQLGAESGRMDLSGIQRLAQNVTEALSPLVPQAAPPAASPAPAAGAAASPGTLAAAPAGAASLDAASPAMAKVTSDLASEASATTTADKANFNSAAIKDLLAAVGSPAPSDGTAPAAATLVATAPAATAPTAAAPTQGPAMSQHLGTDVLQSLGQLSDVANQSGAPASTQDAIARLIGLIQNMFRSSAAPVASASAAAPATPAAAQATLPAPVQNTPCQPAAQPAKAAGQPPAADTSGLVAVLQQLQAILDQLKPYLANSPKGNAAMDGVAKVVSEIAKALQGSAKPAVA